LIWYQIEPVIAYRKLKQFDKVFSLTDQIFRSGNPSAAELYHLRGESFMEMGQKSEADKEFNKAWIYNKHLFPESINSFTSEQDTSISQ
jgi:hypothetical protein